MSNILVVGGAGYIGSHVVYELVKNNENVIVLDNLSTGFEKAINKNAKFYEGDIRNKNFLSSIFKIEKIEAVIHFAAFSQVGESMLNPLKYYNNNVNGTEVLLEAMVENNVKFIIFSSTAAVYGEPETTPILESSPTKPTNCYGATKLAVENMLKWTSIAHNLKFISLRYFNACGADLSAEIGEAHSFETHLIPLILKVAINKKEYINVFGTDYNTKDGTAIRDYIHVTDLAQAHILALKYLENGGDSDIFNLGGGTGLSVREIIKAAQNITNCIIPVKEKPRRKGDPCILVASSEKAERVLNWKQQYSNIKTILSSAFKWHKLHPNGYI